MTAQQPVSLMVITLWFGAWWLPAATVAQTNSGGKKQINISTEQFTLHTRNDQYYLSLNSAIKSPAIPIKNEWLKPPEIKEEEEGIPFSTTLYSERVTSFPIGNGEIGLQFSSFDMMTEGSMMGAGGRDVFLIFNPSDNSLRTGLIDLGITKERSRGEGCFSALMTHFLIADANHDGNLDIGVVREEIKCPEQEDWLNPPSYVQHVLHWYLFRPEGWKKEEEDNGWPDDYAELPLIDMYLSPVDFVGAVLWRTHDPSKWMTPPFFTPQYRKTLIEQDKRRAPSQGGAGKSKSERPLLSPERDLRDQHP
jgi:hypothetical protein